MRKSSFKCQKKDKVSGWRLEVGGKKFGNLPGDQSEVAVFASNLKRSAPQTFNPEP
jgi:hypothetical protein